jgi:hypothetical protein
VSVGGSATRVAPAGDNGAELSAGRHYRLISSPVPYAVVHGGLGIASARPRESDNPHDDRQHG